MRSSSKKRLYLLALVFLFFSAWSARYYSTWVGSPVPTGYGVNIDWTRDAIASGKDIHQLSGEPLTRLSSYAGNQSYDLSAHMLGILTLIIGTDTVGSSLRAINAFPIVGVLILPLIVLIVSQKRLNSNKKTTLLIIALALFPAAEVVNKTSTVWHPEIYSTVILLTVFTFVQKIRDSKRMVIVVVGLSSFMMTLYHTWVFLFLIIIGGLLIFDQLLPVEHQSDRLADPTIVPLLLLVFVAIGAYYNERFAELVLQLFGLVAKNEHSGFFSAADSELVGTSVSQVTTDLNIRRSMKIVNLFSSFVIILVFMTTRFYRIIWNDEYAFLSKYDRTTFLAILVFPAIVLTFFGLGGTTVVIGRTHYIGVYFVMLAAGILIVQDTGIARKAGIGLSLVVVISCLLTLPFVPGLTTPEHTIDQSAAIEHTGEYVEEEKYVFSDAAQGMPLLYYDHQGIVTIDPINSGWEDRMRQVYFEPSCSEGIGAIESAVQVSQLGDANDPDEIYLLFSGEMEREGVKMLSFQSRPPGNFTTVYQNCNSLSKNYSNGDNTLYHSE